MSRYNYNREWPTQKVLEFLRAQLPEQYELAEIVGKWIWLDFPKASHRAVAPYAAYPQDPLVKYGSYFAASKLA